MAEKTPVSKAQKTFDSLKYPVVLFGLVWGLSVTPLTPFTYMHEWKWFHYHPISMVLGFVVLNILGTLMKKIGGLEATKYHGYLMNFGLFVSLFGFYVIYTNKEILGKSHFTTLHGQCGLITTISYLALGLVGGVALHPEFGALKTNKTIRFAHKWGGRAVTALAWFTAFTGYQGLKNDVIMQCAIAGILLSLSYVTLL
jgi:hypothetical protein